MPVPMIGIIGALARAATADANVVEWDRRNMAFFAGAKAFLEGRPNIENLWSDEEWSGALNEGQARWLGWMLERALTMRQENAVREYIERGHDLPPDIA